MRSAAVRRGERLLFLRDDPLVVRLEVHQGDLLVQDQVALTEEPSELLQAAGRIREDQPGGPEGVGTVGVPAAYKIQELPSEHPEG